MSHTTILGFLGLVLLLSGCMTVPIETGDDLEYLGTSGLGTKESITLAKDNEVAGRSLYEAYLASRVDNSPSVAVAESAVKEWCGYTYRKVVLDRSEGKEVYFIPETGDAMEHIERFPRILRLDHSGRHVMGRMSSLVSCEKRKRGILTAGGNPFMIIITESGNSAPSPYAIFLSLVTPYRIGVTTQSGNWTIVNGTAELKYAGGL